MSNTVTVAEAPEVKTFDSLMQATEAFNELQETAATEKAENAELIANADKELDAKNAEIAELKSTIEATEGERDEALAKVTEIEKAVEAQENEIERKAAQMAAESGAEPIEELDRGDKGENEMARAEFEKLDMNARVEFFKAGGKLVD